MKLKKYFLNKYKNDWHQCQNICWKLSLYNKYNEKDNRSILWIKMQDTHGKMAVKSMFDPTVKAIKGIYDTKTPTK